MALLTGFQAPSVKKAKLYFKRHRDASGPQPPSTGGRAGTGRASAADPEAEGTAAPANDVRKARAAALLRAGWGGGRRGTYTISGISSLRLLSSSGMSLGKKE